MEKVSEINYDRLLEIKEWLLSLDHVKLYRDNCSAKDFVRFTPSYVNSIRMTLEWVMGHFVGDDFKKATAFTFGSQNVDWGSWGKSWFNLDKLSSEYLFYPFYNLLTGDNLNGIVKELVERLDYVIKNGKMPDDIRAEIVEKGAIDE